MAEWKAPDGADTGLEEMRTSVLSDWLDTCSLAFVPQGRTVLVDRVAADEAFQRLAKLGIERGVSITCVRHDGDTVRVRLPSGVEVSLDRRDAWVLQVTPPATPSARFLGTRRRRWRRSADR